MAGTFVHFLTASKLCQDAAALDRIGSLTNEIKFALMNYSNYCRLGAVSPDLPYLDVHPVWGTDSKHWGDMMHYWNTTCLVRNAIPLVSDMDLGTVDARYCIAWLFGYVAHVVTDLTVHPIVNLSVGSYEHNPIPHRVCEMNQDVFMFNKETGESITTSKYLIERSGIAACAIDLTQNKNKLNIAVKQLWETCLKQMPHVGQVLENGVISPSHEPDIDHYFEQYIEQMHLSSKGRRNNPLWTRLVDDVADILYPSDNKIKKKYIENLKCPDKKIRQYNEVFDITVANISEAWNSLGIALNSNNSELFILPNGNLDTGNRDNTQEMIYWRQPA